MSTEFYPLTISKIERLTQQAVAVEFEIPDHLQQKFSFTQGQHLTLKADIKNKLFHCDHSVQRSIAILTELPRYSEPKHTKTYIGLLSLFKTKMWAILKSDIHCTFIALSSVEDKTIGQLFVWNCNTYANGFGIQYIVICLLLSYLRNVTSCNKRVTK